MGLSLELSPNAAARTNKAQRAAAKGARSFLPFIQGWQPLVRPQPVLHTVIHICRTLDHRVESLRRDSSTAIYVLHGLSEFAAPHLVSRVPPASAKKHSRNLPIV